METHPCPKCNESMDEGQISFGDPVGYVSQKQTGMVRRPTTIKQARDPRTILSGVKQVGDTVTVTVDSPAC